MAILENFQVVIDLEVAIAPAGAGGLRGAVRLTGMAVTVATLPSALSAHDDAMGWNRLQLLQLCANPVRVLSIRKSQQEMESTRERKRWSIVGRFRNRWMRSVSISDESLRGDERLSRSYLAVRHLLRQLEIKREKGIRSRIIPSWFSKFVEEISERFEPFSGIARVGYECAFSEGVWEISIFLGETELIGGAEDGRLMPVNFRFDLTTIVNQFDCIESIHWNAFPNSPVETGQQNDLSFLTVTGIVQSETVFLQLHSTPPNLIGPGIRQHSDGRMELT